MRYRDEVLKSLKGARELLSSPSRWIRGGYCRVLDQKTCYCLVGALRVSYSNYYKVELENHVLATIEELGYRDDNGRPYRYVELFNDALGRIHPHILHVLNLAIETLQGDEHATSRTPGGAAQDSKG